jgi:hypothetical protein
MHLVVGESTQRIQKQKASKKQSTGLAQKFPAPEMAVSMIISQMLYVWNIYLQNWVIFGVNVGKYSSTMEHLGYDLRCKWKFWKLLHCF